MISLLRRESVQGFTVNHSSRSITKAPQNPSNPTIMMMADDSSNNHKETSKNQFLPLILGCSLLFTTASSSMIPTAAFAADTTMNQVPVVLVDTNSIAPNDAVMASASQNQFQELQRHYSTQRTPRSKSALYYYPRTPSSSAVTTTMNARSQTASILTGTPAIEPQQQQEEAAAALTTTTPSSTTTTLFEEAESSVMLLRQQETLLLEAMENIGMASFCGISALQVVGKKKKKQNLE
eukprot:CAMPEP_0202443528 /NCGR_PEP_ID=MMETSP1360-20130828/2755_1 /ASSEMBLY_ACC=CAM_ASM_000848 /TAXON_ID=515479 /ORGANISM="Licmophora paradoxa, Strain CCMP2313" /LENGTH=236 /DNA_ID=CAMNT_0049059229 /DNA_START=42 /DNA_END=752 /DNA_ORIENTATION=-